MGCERPRRLLLTTWEDGSPEKDSTLEASLSTVDGGTRLVIEERGVPIDQIASYAAGWHVHAEDLASHLAGRERDTDSN